MMGGLGDYISLERHFSSYCFSPCLSAFLAVGMGLVRLFHPFLPSPSGHMRRRLTVCTQANISHK